MPDELATSSGSPWDHYDGIGPEGGVPVFGFRLLVSIAPDGTEAVNWGWDGESIRTYAAVGALEAAKQEMFHNQAHDEED